MMAAIVMENGLLRAEFDGRTGALSRLVSKLSGWQIAGRAELGESFRLLVPLADRRHNLILGSRQSSPRVELSPQGDRLTLFWSGLESEFGGHHEIDFRQTITLAEDGLSFEGSLENRSDLTVESVSWPCLGDLTRPAAEAPFEKLSLGYSGYARSGLFPTFDNNQGYWGSDYPTQKCMTPGSPFLLFQSPGVEGLYVGLHDTRNQYALLYTVELKPGYLYTTGMGRGVVPGEESIGGEPVQMVFRANHLPFVAPGERVELGRVVLAPYVGSWHKGADYYVNWRRSWFARPPQPQWTEEVHSWQQVHINSAEDELRCRYEQLVQYGEDCARHNVRAIQLVGWNDGGQDRGNPSHDCDSRLGSAEDLRAAIKAIQKLGVRLVLFSKFTWADRSRADYEQLYAASAARDPYGDVYHHSGYDYQTPTQWAGINTRRLIPMCTMSGRWQEQAREEFEKLMSYGADGTLYDESQHHAPAVYCFDSRHGHRVPAHVYEGDALIGEQFRRIMASVTGEFLLAGEACYDLELRHYSLAYTRLDGLGHIPMHRYVDPQAMLMIAVSGHNDRTTLNQALLYRYIISYEPRNFKGRLYEFPLTMSYGRQVDELRRRYADFLWRGTFRDRQQATVLSEGSDGTIVWSLFSKIGRASCRVRV